MIVGAIDETTLPHINAHQSIIKKKQQVQLFSANHTEKIVPVSVKETPIIERNKMMRNQSMGGPANGRRRSSFSLRGKRVSSAHNGLCGLPHASIQPSDYYRHIDAEQSEPVRMRQLLVWCAERSALRMPKSIPHGSLQSKLCKFI